MLNLELWTRVWKLVRPFEIARGTLYDTPTIQVRLTDANGLAGRGEAVGVPYQGDTPATLAAEIEAVRPAIEQGIDREGLLSLLPAGGARHALDAALWDLEAKRDGISPFARANVEAAPVDSDRTVGMGSLAAYEQTAHDLALHKVIKVKVGPLDGLAAVEAVRRGAPNAQLIVDPNQSWSVERMKDLSPGLADLGVVLLEQPIPVGAEADLGGWLGPIPIAADELINDERDLDKAEGRFQYVNIKLDKSGGLTAALRLADEAERRGFKLMVGCMAGSSLSMAPAMVLAQRCVFVDLDGPPLQVGDFTPGLIYTHGHIARPHVPELWG